MAAEWVRIGEAQHHVGQEVSSRAGSTTWPARASSSSCRCATAPASCRAWWRARTSPRTSSQGGHLEQESRSSSPAPVREDNARRSAWSSRVKASSRRRRRRTTRSRRRARAAATSTPRLPHGSAPPVAALAAGRRSCACAPRNRRRSATTSTPTASTLVDAPIFTPNACEGTTNAVRDGYFDGKAYLTQSGQLYGEAAARWRSAGSTASAPRSAPRSPRRAAT